MLKEALRRETETIIFGGNDRRAIHAARRIRRIFDQARITAGLSTLPSTLNKTVEGGYAISPSAAAYCIDSEPARTVALIRGLHQALQESRATSHVLEAGSGPYAPIVASLASTLNPDQIQISAIDIHPGSIEIIRAITPILGLQDHLCRTQVGDLCKDDFSSFNPDILICEVMEAALLEEPQGAAIAHLSQQFDPEQTLFLPEEITVTAYLGRRKLGELVRIDQAFRKKAAKRQSSINTLTRVHKRFQLPKATEDNDTLTIKTNVRIFGDIILRSERSSIVSSLHFNVPTDTQEIELAYRMGDMDIKPLFS